jgi:hypothetical protein
MMEESKLDENEDTQQQQHRVYTEGDTYVCDPVKMMERNLANISAIYPRSPILLNISNRESFDLSYIDRN